MVIKSMLGQPFKKARLLSVNRRFIAMQGAAAAASWELTVHIQYF